MGHVQERPEPPFPEQGIQAPGQEHELDPRPQYLAPAYRGSGKLQDEVALMDSLGDRDKVFQQRHPWTPSQVLAVTDEGFSTQFACGNLIWTVMTAGLPSCGRALA